MLRLDGREVAKVRRQEIRARIEEYKIKHGRAPGLAVVLVGDDPASHVYVGNKEKACVEVGIESFGKRLPATVSAAELKETITTLNNDSRVDGILVQLPLPKHLNADEILSCIDPTKDPDGLHVENMGLLYAGRPRSIPCTPFGVMKILEHYKIPVEGRHAVVVGRSNIVGKPMAQLFLQANATVTMCHSRTKPLEEFTRQGDIVVVAAGQPRFLGKEAFKKGAVVIDVGMHRLPSDGPKPKLAGDVRYEELEGVASAATPVPGGVGPMTITMLLENTLRLASLRK